MKIQPSLYTPLLIGAAFAAWGNTPAQRHAGAIMAFAYAVVIFLASVVLAALADHDRRKRHAANVARIAAASKR